ncbi:conserved hypothetical protein [Ricinus communis]|uniref:Uncharacterized protein n=1 Tax=Ricinus communis TaxID=3988 RepID=B9T9C1_RICCO|nr:conserved hypothetical protein [Ricinus communis]
MPCNWRAMSPSKAMPSCCRPLVPASICSAIMRTAPKCSCKPCGNCKRRPPDVRGLAQGSHRGNSL